MSEPRLEFSPLLDWAEGRLSPQASQEVALLLDQADEATRATAAWLRSFVLARRAVRLASPPAETRDLLRQHFASAVRARRGPKPLERLAAALRFDSAAQPYAAMGLRTAGGAVYQPRQLIFSCSVADIALNIHRRHHDEQVDLSGQIFPHGSLVPYGWGVVLIGEAGPDATNTDELGEFGFEALPPGDYTVSIETGKLAITIPMVSLER